MTTVVVEPPEPYVTPEDVPGSHAPDDPAITAFIAASMEKIDGPTGWVGRSFGPQTIERYVSAFDPRGVKLYCPPIIEIVSVTYDAGDGTTQTIDPADYVLINGFVRPAWGKSWPMIRVGGQAAIRYRAGYDSSTTGNIPERARQAILLSVGEMQSVGNGKDLFLSERTVQGVGTRRYVVSAAAQEAIERTTARLLDGLWLPRL